MTLKEAVYEAWKIWRRYPANTGNRVVVYRFSNQPENYRIEEFVDYSNTWHVIGSQQVLSLASPRLYEGERRRATYLLREAMADALANIEARRGR